MRSSSRPTRNALVLIFLAAIGCAVLGSQSVIAPNSVRVWSSVIVGLGLAGVCIANPRKGLLATILFLPFLGLARRLLIPLAGWNSYDGLLLVGPAISVILLIRPFAIEKKRLAAGFVSGIVLILILIAVAESVNPANGGLLPGLLGLLFIGAPLVWYFVGQQYLDPRVALTMLNCFIVASVAVAAYGLWQLLVGFPSWDADWVRLDGYTALNVGGVIRPFGTLSSSSEYATILGVGLVLILARRRVTVSGLVGLLVLATALILDSARTPLVLTIVASIAVLSLRARSRSIRLLVPLLAPIASIALIVFLGPFLQANAAGSGNPLLAHQITGLLNPLNSTVSTLPAHVSLVQSGFAMALQHPLGLGTSATNLGGQRLGGGTAATEIDISNAFVSLGLVGGFLFAVIVVLTLRRAIRLSLYRENLIAASSVGVFLVALGQWLNGGFYALAPIIWLLVGAINTMRHQDAEIADSTGDIAITSWASDPQVALGASSG